MNSLAKKIPELPLVIRVVPFALFLFITALQGELGESSRYWLYLGKTIAGIAFIWMMRPLVAEMRWTFSWEAVVVGVAVCVMWVGIDGFYPTFSEIIQKYLCPFLKAIGLPSWCPQPSKPELPWNPHAQFGLNSPLAWLFIMGRLLGSSLIVPPLEEVFYRSFLYRYIIKPDFLNVPLGMFHPVSFLVTALVFGMSHHEWLAGILCGFAYQGLVIWKKRLGDAITAHAITNFLLGLWILWRGAWNFW